MTIKNIFICTFFLFYSFHSSAQEVESKPDFERQYFVGSQAFMAFNLFFDPSPNYYQLSLGYRFSSKDEIALEAITWTYQGPLGRPHGPNFENPASNFPGDVKNLGMGLAYKRLVWKGAYVQIHSTAFRQIYRDEQRKEIQRGFQLFNTFRIGYHFKLFKSKRWFIAPSIAATYWPINTNLPDSFQIEEDKWPNYFLFEPGLQFGYTF